MVAKVRYQHYELLPSVEFTDGSYPYSKVRNKIWSSLQYKDNDLGLLTTT